MGSGQGKGRPPHYGVAQFGFGGEDAVGGDPDAGGSDSGGSHAEAAQSGGQVVERLDNLGCCWWESFSGVAAASAADEQDAKGSYSAVK